MRSHQRLWAVCATALLAACATDAPAPAALEAVAITSVQIPASTPADPPVLAATPALPAAVAPAVEPGGERVVVTGGAWKGGLAAYIRALSDTSCAPGARQQAEEALAIKVTPVPLQAINPARKKIGQLTFVAGFQLASQDTRFGGLSGIDVLDNGNLLAVSDRGDFVWIDLAPDGFTPVRARVAAMHDARGEALRGPADGDAEGLAVNAGVALVSFERNHRVLAFDLGRCGAAARGAPIVFGPFGLALSDAFTDQDIQVDANQGAESLAVTDDWYLFTGIETKADQLSPMSARPIEAAPDFAHRIGVDAPEFVGLDVIRDTKGEGGVRTFSLHRSFSPLSGNAITINETDFHRYLDQSNLPRRIEGDIDERARYLFAETGWRRLAEFNVLVTIDNFEGIAAKELPDGRVRLYVISDDNFSTSQRTLLMVFDLAKPLR